MIPRAAYLVLFLFPSGLFLVSGLGAEEQPALLRSGSYEVVYRLELPHLERWAVEKTATLCIGEPEEQGLFPVLSGNMPFAECRVENVRSRGAELSYDIRCPGRASARAHAVYSLEPEGFKGSISMVMGAKNMTMTEVQAARRTNACDSTTALVR